MCSITCKSKTVNYLQRVILVILKIVFFLYEIIITISRIM